MTSTSFINNNKPYRKILGIAGALLTLAVPYFIMQQNEHQHIENQQSLCPFMMLTGLPCPGCGITKSFIFLYEGDILKSFYYHLFGPLTFIACILAIFILSTELFTGKEYFVSLKYNKKLAYVMGITLGVYHLARLLYFISTHNLQDVLHQSIWA